MKKLFKSIIRSFVLKNFPFKTTTKVIIDKYETIYVKKGKIREWRTYKEGVRQRFVKQ